MKSVKMFGKKVPILAILVIVLISGVGVYGAVVNYLSGTTTSTMSVESPLILSAEMYFGEELIGSLDSNSAPTANLGYIFAGSTINTEGRVRNLANNPIQAIVATVIPTPAEWGDGEWTTDLSDLTPEFCWIDTWYGYNDYGEQYKIVNGYVILISGGHMVGDHVEYDTNVTPVPAEGSTPDFLSRLTLASNIEGGTFILYSRVITDGTLLVDIPGLAGVPTP